MTALPAPGHAALATALLDPQGSCPGGLRAWNGSDPARRFAVHRNNVVSSLIGALADTFPVVQALVGAEFFQAMAGVFVRQHPPRSRVLAHYGSGFADFVADFEPARDVPYLADIARLELARVRAFHAADARPVTAADASLALGAGERIGELRLTVHPSVAVVSSPYAIVSLWAAHQGHGDLAQLDVTSAETALVLRPELDVLVLACDPGTAAFLLCLQGGADLARSASAAIASVDDFDLTAALGTLLAHGALIAIALPDGDSP